MNNKDIEEVIEGIRGFYVNLADESYWVAEWLIRFGGSFSSSLGEALAHADCHNQEKIKKMWPHLWEQALEDSTERRKNKNYY